MQTKYRIFVRSATRFEHLARKGRTIRKGLTIEEARQFCLSFNTDRTPAQVKAGTKAEFTAQ